MLWKKRYGVKDWEVSINAFDVPLDMKAFNQEVVANRILMRLAEEEEDRESVAKCQAWIRENQHVLQSREYLKWKREQEAYRRSPEGQRIAAAMREHQARIFARLEKESPI